MGSGIEWEGLFGVVMCVFCEPRDTYYASVAASCTCIVEELSYRSIDNVSCVQVTFHQTREMPQATMHETSRALS